MKFLSQIGEPKRAVVHYITVSFVYKREERFRRMMICMSDLRPGILLHLVLLQRAFGSLQRGWKEDVDFDSTVNSMGPKAAFYLPVFICGRQTLLDLSFPCLLGRCDT